jgi:uncharacterized LabA/DUF88 family protein
MRSARKEKPSCLEENLAVHEVWMIKNLDMNEILTAMRDGRLSKYSQGDLQSMMPICHLHIQNGHAWATPALEAVENEIRRNEARLAQESEANRHAERLARAQRAMIFVDGTNLFYRLQAEKLIVPRIHDLFTQFACVAQMREIVRVYLYSVQERVDEALKIHGLSSLQGIRVVLGDGIRTSDGNVKEKGVDALLVADVVYHAASRNCDVAIIVSTDTDFTFAIKRVEDFGCRTAVGGICSEVPARLQQSSDRTFTLSASDILSAGLGRRS